MAFETMKEGGLWQKWARKSQRFSVKGKPSERVECKEMGANVETPRLRGSVLVRSYGLRIDDASPSARISTSKFKGGEIMAEKFYSKVLSVGLSLAMCAGMVAPAFAAACIF